MQHVLPPLPYDCAALEPHIDMHTVMRHHGQRHADYVADLNRALEKFPDLQQRSVSWLLANGTELPDAVRAEVLRCAGGHMNHSLFWPTMSPSGGGAPAGPLAEAIARDFGSFEQFKAAFVTAGAGIFGSGWVWLVRAGGAGGRLEICTTLGNESPAVAAYTPLLLNDVWGHAYYLKYAGRRAEYLNAWWSVVDWDEVARRFDASAAGA